MSAKEHRRTASIVLPDLPPEIWLSIFRLATWSPDMFNPKLTVFMGIGWDTSYRAQLRVFKESLVTKRYLVRVCKSWYSLASPFLFEYIFLGRGRVLASLWDGMLRFQQGVGFQGLPYAIGWQTQRLDVHMRDRTDNPELIMDILADILRRLPNLRILTFAVIGHGYDACVYLPENVLQATSACRDTLQLLNCYGGLEPSSNIWPSFLENHPRLEAINAPVDLIQRGNSHIVLDSLKSIYVHPSAFHVENELWNIHLPNIQHAIYDIIYSTFDSDDFLPKIGPKLTTIQINVDCLTTTQRVERLPCVLSKIEVNCRNLKRVDVVTDDWELFCSLYFPETVHTLGIRVTTYQIPKRFLEAIFGAIHVLLSRSPSVKTICFMDQRNIRTLRAHPQALSPNFARIVTLGVNLTDEEGRSLVV